MDNTNYERPSLPNQAFDLEYNTQFKKEVEYLHARGFEPTYVKRTGHYRVRTYKYTKTPELFLAVADFYRQQRQLKEYEKLQRQINAVSAVVSGLPEERDLDGYTSDAG